jgi:ABC-type transporter Mla maintaining outer membrane lipid asymmetry ATPase subunit MlaF
MAGPQFVFVMKGLSKTYPGGKQVLKDIWLSFYPGAKIGIVGVNGAGKSTLMRLMAGQDKEFTGYQVVITTDTPGAGESKLCAPDANGLEVLEFLSGAHARVSVTSLFRNMRLLGPKPAAWTARPIS